MPLSSSKILLIPATIIGTIFLSFGINAIVSPRAALAIFEFSPPTSAADAQLVDALLVLYGVRDIFMGLVIYAGAYFGSRKCLGWILMAASAVAVGDGLIVKGLIGRGEWNHWGYAPMVGIVGGLLAGVADGSSRGGVEGKGR